MWSWANITQTHKSRLDVCGIQGSSNKVNISFCVSAGVRIYDCGWLIIAPLGLLSDRSCKRKPNRRIPHIYWMLARLYGFEDPRVGQFKRFINKNMVWSNPLTTKCVCVCLGGESETGKNAFDLNGCVLYASPISARHTWFVLWMTMMMMTTEKTNHKQTFAYGKHPEHTPTYLSISIYTDLCGLGEWHSRDSGLCFRYYIN